jgi:hypothetical protein
LNLSAGYPVDMSPYVALPHPDPHDKFHNASQWK